MKWLALACTLQSLACILSAAPGNLLATLPNPVPEANARFGHASSDTGVSDRMVISAPNAGSGRGRVHAFTHSGTLAATLENPLNEPGRGNYGYSLATAPNGFVLGAPTAFTSGAAVLRQGSDFATAFNVLPPEGSESGYGIAVACAYTRVFFSRAPANRIRHFKDRGVLIADAAPNLVPKIRGQVLHPSSRIGQR